MKQLLFFIALIISSISNAQVLDGIIKGGKIHSYIPYSDTKGVDTIATQQYLNDNYFSRNSKLFLAPRPDRIPLWITRKAKAGSGSNTQINKYATLAHFGGAEWGANIKYGIGFGYLNPTDTAKYSPVWIGIDQVNSDLHTASDFIVATRSSIDDTAPTVKFRVTTDGYIKAWVGYVPKTKDDIVNKAYLDYRIPEPPAKGTYVLKSVDGVVNWSNEL